MGIHHHGIRIVQVLEDKPFKVGRKVLHVFQDVVCPEDGVLQHPVGAFDGLIPHGVTGADGNYGNGDDEHYCGKQDRPETDPCRQGTSES